jgi:hypothetical protein
MGTLSILASLDLHTGKVIALVEKQHRNTEFINLLKKLDEYYPSHNKIRIILDNHSSYQSKETMKYLAEHPNRFIYVIILAKVKLMNLGYELRRQNDYAQGTSMKYKVITFVTNSPAINYTRFW